MMQIIKSVDQWIKIFKTKQKEGKTVGLIPTMGALHAGHISLIKGELKPHDTMP